MLFRNKILCLAACSITTASAFAPPFSCNASFLSHHRTNAGPVSIDLRTPLPPSTWVSRFRSTLSSDLQEDISSSEETTSRDIPEFPLQNKEGIYEIENQDQHKWESFLFPHFTTDVKYIIFHRALRLSCHGTNHFSSFSIMLTFKPVPGSMRIQTKSWWSNFTRRGAGLVNLSNRSSSKYPKVNCHIRNVFMHDLRTSFRRWSIVLMFHSRTCCRSKIQRHPHHIRPNIGSTQQSLHQISWNSSAALRSDLCWIRRSSW